VILTFGMSWWPAWMHHAHREQHWRVLGIIEPENAAPSPPAIDRYVLLVDGPFAYLKGSAGEQYITATRRGGRWWIKPNTSANPRRGIPPGELPDNAPANRMASLGMAQSGRSRGRDPYPMRPTL
jgi:hypothetical protein